MNQCIICGSYLPTNERRCASCGFDAHSPEPVLVINPTQVLVLEAVEKALDKRNPGPVLQPSGEDALVERIAEKVLAKLEQGKQAAPVVAS